MPYVEQSVLINAPVEAVFHLVAHQPERMAEWWPPIALQERVTPPPTAVGSVARYVYHMMNVIIRGEHEVREMVENRRLVVETISGIASRFEFDFEPTAQGTRLHVKVNYSLPGSMVGQVMNRVMIEDRNRKDLQEGLRNLKQIAESEIALGS